MITDAIKIRSRRIGRREMRQIQLTIPKHWVEEVGLREGDKIAIYQDKKNNLIVVAEKQEKAS